MQGNPFKILSLVSFISQMSNQMLWERVVSVQGHLTSRKSHLQLITSVCSFFHSKHLWTFFASDMVEHNFIKFADEQKLKERINMLEMIK